eukprot:scpid102794/ scgid35018/ 
MDEHLQLHHSADADVTALAVPDHVTASEHGSCLPPEDRVPVSLGAPAVHEDDRLSQEKELLEGEASETQSSSHSVEEKEPSELDSVQNGLESIPFDVWQERLLPMLSIRDVYRVCGVTRKIREMLYNEYTFKRLCEHRYQLCPRVGVQYIQRAKDFYIADCSWMSREFQLPSCDLLLSSIGPITGNKRPHFLLDWPWP